jgi:hypothetical protein
MKIAKASIAENPERAVMGVFDRGYKALRVLLVHNGEARELHPERWRRATVAAHSATS